MWGWLRVGLGPPVLEGKASFESGSGRRSAQQHRLHGSVCRTHSQVHLTRCRRRSAVFSARPCGLVVEWSSNGICVQIPVSSVMGALYSMNNGYFGSLNAAESCVRLRLWLLSWHFASSEAATGISCGSSLWGSPSGGLQNSVAKLFGKPPS